MNITSMNITSMNITSIVIGVLFGVLFMVILQAFSRRHVAGELKDAIRVLVRQASRWSTASKQDNNSMIQLLHANYGASFMWALEDIASDREIESAVPHIDLAAFRREIVSTQDFATKKMARLCPKFAPKKTVLTALGGEG